MPQGEETHVLDNVFQPVQEKDDSNQERDMVVPGDHVLRAQVNKGGDCRAAVRLDEGRIALRHVVSAGSGRKYEGRQDQRDG